jgi:hypothetical protein
MLLTSFAAVFITAHAATHTVPARAAPSSPFLSIRQEIPNIASPSFWDEPISIPMGNWGLQNGAPSPDGPEPESDGEDGSSDTSNTNDVGSEDIPADDVFPGVPIIGLPAYTSTPYGRRALPNPAPSA